MLNIEYTTQFKRDLKLFKKRRKNLDVLQKIMSLISEQKQLSVNLRDHNISGNWHHHRELHIEPDWLLIYRYEHKRNVVVFVRTGTHSDLFS